MLRNLFFSFHFWFDLIRKKIIAFPINFAVVVATFQLNTVAKFISPFFPIRYQNPILLQISIRFKFWIYPFPMWKQKTPEPRTRNVFISLSLSVAKIIFIFIIIKRKETGKKSFYHKIIILFVDVDRRRSYKLAKKQKRKKRKIETGILINFIMCRCVCVWILKHDFIGKQNKKKDSRWEFYYNNIDYWAHILNLRCFFFVLLHFFFI